jgi:hypothetical protein
MNESTNPQLARKVELLRHNNSNLWKSLRILNWIGYGFLIFALIDFTALLVPSNFTNPVWEFGFVGKVVEQVAAPLIGFGLVFVGGNTQRLTWEKFTLRVLSWLALVVGLLYLPLIGLGVSSAVRIDRQNEQQLTTEAKQTKTQLQQTQQELQAANTIEQMQALLNRLDVQGRAPEIGNNQQFQTAKQQFGEFLAKREKGLKTQVEATRATQRQGLLKSALKWNLGALLSAALFISIWRGTTEIRSGQ